MQQLQQERTGSIRTSDCGTRQTILLVDDEPAILEITAMMLAHLGYNVLQAYSPLKSLKLVQESGERISLLITDIVMPEMNGLDLSDKITHDFPHIKVLYMSGHLSSMILESLNTRKQAVFLEKPFHLHELKDKIQEAMAG